MRPIRHDRVVVAATGDDARARLHARAQLLSGHEVVFVGAHQDVDQIARTVVAEDAGRVLVDGSPDELAALRAALAAVGLGDVTVDGCDEPVTADRDSGE